MPPEDAARLAFTLTKLQIDFQLAITTLKMIEAQSTDPGSRASARLALKALGEEPYGFDA